MRSRLLLLLLLAVTLWTGSIPVSATLQAALRVTARAADNCFTQGHADMLYELDRLLPPTADETDLARSIYALIGGLRAGRPICAALVSSVGARARVQNELDACRARLGPARAAQRFAATDTLIVCLKTGYHRGGLLALVQTQDEEDALAANAAASAHVEAQA